MELKAPWKDVEVVITREDRQVRIRVERACGKVWGDPDPNENFDRFQGRMLARAMKFLPDWVETARTPEPRPLKKGANTIDEHSEGLLKCLMHPTTNAATEMINSFIQKLQRADRGRPNFPSFPTRVISSLPIPTAAMFAKPCGWRTPAVNRR